MTETATPFNAWLMLAKEVTQHGGNLGYDDSVSEYYSWDDTVPKAVAPKAADKVVVWNGDVLLGVSTIESIEENETKKVRLRCPSCRQTKIKARKKSSPKYRCYGCHHKFSVPEEEQIVVTTYKSQHSSFWYDMHGQVNGKRLRELCLQPKSQHSIRPLKWRPFLESIDPAYRHNLEKVDSLNAGHDLESSDPENLKLGVQGHRVVKVRVRLGQGKFRQELRSKFGDICALSGRNHPSALDAAHLYVYASTGEHNLDGGLLLRKDLHNLFDLGLIGVEPVEERIRIADQLKAFPQYELLDGASPQVVFTEGVGGWLREHWKEHFQRFRQIS